MLVHESIMGPAMVGIRSAPKVGARAVLGLGGLSWHAREGEETEGILTGGKSWWRGDRLGPMTWRIGCGVVWLDVMKFVAWRTEDRGERSYSNNRRGLCSLL
jgi:hypothetical protein